MSSKLKLCSMILSAMVFTTSLKVSDAAIVEYSGGHGDIGMAVEPDGSLFLHYHFGDGTILDGQSNVGDVEYAPSEAYVRVGDLAKLTAPSALSQLGLASGDDVWIAPFNETSGVSILGAGCGRTNCSPEFAEFELIGYNYYGTGSGNFAMWTPGLFGSFNFHMVSNDGVSPADSLSPGIGTHATHVSWGFSSEGVYDLTLQASVFDPTLNGGTTLTDTGTFRFVVGSATAVPEPASMTLLASVQP